MSIFKIEYSTDFLATKSWIASGYSPSQWRKTFEQITQKSTVSFANNFLISNNIITPIKQKNLIIRVFKYKWDQRDSNPRPRDYESPALPLRHSPTAVSKLPSTIGTSSQYHQITKKSSRKCIVIFNNIRIIIIWKRIF